MPTKPSSTHRARCTLCRKLLSRRCRRLSRRSELVELWRAFNLHLHHVMSHADEAKLNTPCTLHTLQEIAFKTVPQAEPEIGAGRVVARLQSSSASRDVACRRSQAQHTVHAAHFAGNCFQDGAAG